MAKYLSEKVYQGDFDTLQQDILQAIYDLYIEDSEPVTVRTVERKVNRLKTFMIYKRLNALLRDGYVFRNQAGKFGNWHLSQRGLKKLSPNFDKGSYEHKRYKFLTELARQQKN